MTARGSMTNLLYSAVIMVTVLHDVITPIGAFEVTQPSWQDISDVSRVTVSRDAQPSPWRLCPTSTPLEECVNFRATLRPGKDDVTIGRDAAVTKRLAAAADADWRTLCPDYNSKSECLASYLSLLSVNTPRSIKYKRGHPGALPPPGAYRLSTLCPNTLTKVACFEKYISLWLHHVSNRATKTTMITSGTYRRNRINRFMGKRDVTGDGVAGGLRGTRMWARRCPPGADTLACFRSYLRLRTLVSQLQALSDDATDAEDTRQTVQPTEEGDDTNPAATRGGCATLRCIYRHQSPQNLKSDVTPPTPQGERSSLARSSLVAVKTVGEGDGSGDKQVVVVADGTEGGEAPPHGDDDNTIIGL